MVLCTWTPVSSDGLCPLDTEGPAHVFKAIQHHPRKKSMLLDKSKQINTWKQPQNDLLMAVADKFNSKYIWILDVNKVITLWTENPLNGCVWILRGWQIKGQRPWKANLANPLWLFSFCEWRSILCTFASKVGACITQVALQLGSWLLVKSVASRPVEVKRGHTLFSPLIPLVIYFLLQSSPLYWEFNTFSPSPKVVDPSGVFCVQVSFPHTKLSTVNHRPHTCQHPGLSASTKQLKVQKLHLKSHELYI